ncbi:hypothetical protein E2562_023394 [Oryza meyeriana var. granulata]|uniref:Uncharacterized protein n=1 Tax=Oryza meyeriana var. granulata TaxID=110450 RepID=A0A6G1E305_9ORYZ|nr:hypothetical protein E2562_023394 [Oryza meyeriana var. granulata]
MASFSAYLNLRRNAVMLNVRRLLRAVQEDAPSALVAVGLWTSCTAVRAVATGPPEWALTSACGHGQAYYMAAIGGAFVGGVGTMWAGVWVSSGNARRRATGKWILCAAFLPLAIILGLSDAEIIFNL